MHVRHPDKVKVPIVTAAARLANSVATSGQPETTLLATETFGEHGARARIRLTLDYYSNVNSVVCFVGAPLPDAANLVSLYGLHEKYLNRLLSRYREGLIIDLFTFFRQSWATAFYHDRAATFLGKKNYVFILTLFSHGSKLSSR